MVRTTPLYGLGFIRLLCFGKRIGKGKNNSSSNAIAIKEICVDLKDIILRGKIISLVDRLKVVSYDVSKNKRRAGFISD